MRVFIENKAGSNTRNFSDQRTPAHLGSTRVSLPNPYPYGFVVDTLSGDSDAVDCFVLTDGALRAGETIDCEPVGLLEQVEDGEIDHKVLAVLSGDRPIMKDSCVEGLKSFISGVFAHVAGKQMAIGKLLGRADAEAYIAACQQARAVPGAEDT